MTKFDTRELSFVAEYGLETLRIGVLDPATPFSLIDQDRLTGFAVHHGDKELARVDMTARVIRSRFGVADGKSLNPMVHKRGLAVCVRRQFNVLDGSPIGNTILLGITHDDQLPITQIPCCVA